MPLCGIRALLFPDIRHPISPPSFFRRTAAMNPEIIALPDREVDAATDQAIRDLLTTCFTEDGDDVFLHRRYWKEPYPNRFVIRGPGESLVAHVGVHEKEIWVGDVRHRFGGIAEVCVHPDARGRGMVRAMLAFIHPWLAERGFAYAILFGNPEVYTSSGYRVVGDIMMDDDPHQPDGNRHPVAGSMVHPLGSEPWPDGEVFLPGVTF